MSKLELTMYEVVAGQTGKWEWDRKEDLVIGRRSGNPFSTGPRNFSREQAVLGAKGDKSLLTHLGRNPATIVNREGTQTLGKHSKPVEVYHGCVYASTDKSWCIKMRDPRFLLPDDETDDDETDNDLPPEDGGAGAGGIGGAGAGAGAGSAGAGSIPNRVLLSELAKAARAASSATAEVAKRHKEPEPLPSDEPTETPGEPTETPGKPPADKPRGVARRGRPPKRGRGSGSKVGAGRGRGAKTGRGRGRGAKTGRGRGKRGPGRPRKRPLPEPSESEYEDSDEDSDGEDNSGESDAASLESEVEVIDEEEPTTKKQRT